MFYNSMGLCGNFTKSWPYQVRNGSSPNLWELRDCAKAAGLGTGKRITNHNARKTLVQKLRESDVPPTEIVQITGHKNLQSINNYSSSGEKQQMAISTLLSTACSSTSVSQQLQSQTVPQPVTQQEFSSTFVPSKS